MNTRKKGLISTVGKLILAAFILFVLYLIIRKATDKSFTFLDTIKNLWGPSP